jgi:hypothetical protein
VVIQPVGFLYDHDIAFQETARNLGLKLIRAGRASTIQCLIDALEDLVLYGKELFRCQYVIVDRCISRPECRQFQFEKLTT